MADSRVYGNTNSVKFTPSDWNLVEGLLKGNLSPEQIATRTSIEKTLSICHESIYGHIHKDKKQGGNLYTLLRCQKKRKKRYGSSNNRRSVIKDQVRIDKRPKVIDGRKRKGDFEGDTIIGKAHKGVIVTIVDRKTRFLLAKKAESKKAADVTSAILSVLNDHKVRSITYDNGGEFALHKQIAELTNSKSYFANPYHSWERGTNENTNGLLRQYFPKHTDFTKVTEEQLQLAVNEINHRPRKVLEYKSAYEAYYGINLNYT